MDKRLMEIEESSADFKPINPSDRNNSFFFSSSSLTKCVWLRCTFLVYHSEGHFAWPASSLCIFLQSSFMNLMLLKYLRSEIFYFTSMTSRSLKPKWNMEHNESSRIVLRILYQEIRGSTFCLRTRKGLSQIAIFSARNVQIRFFFSKQT